jgi:beta-lactamase superfamily II metal-dependent hydrolase
MLDLGDADCLLVTGRCPNGVGSVLIDGGSGVDAPAVKDFLRWKGSSVVYSIVCTHPHNDHAAGLIKLLEDKSVVCCTGWMHDIRKHVNPNTLRRQMAEKSDHADWVKQVVENTERLAKAFALRGITPQEPFAGKFISYLPLLEILGPDEQFYRDTLKEFLEVDVPAVPTLSQNALADAVSSFLGSPAEPARPFPFSLAPPSPAETFKNSLYSLAFPPEPSFKNSLYSLAPPVAAPSLYEGLLKGFSVQENPKTQPFNNTSVILGASFDGQRLLFTGDAGAEALDRVPADWRNLTWMQVPHHGSDGNLSQSNIERFCPKFAYISAKGDTSHPSQAIVNGLVKVGAQVASTHNNRNLWFGIGGIAPPGYGPLTLLKGNVARSAGLGRL